jgi:hypothetical protein
MRLSINAGALGYQDPGKPPSFRWRFTRASLLVRVRTPARKALVEVTQASCFPALIPLLRIHLLPVLSDITVYKLIYGRVYILWEPVFDLSE